ncbi:isopenicillin N synthase family dioxygenase [Streptomyces sp. NPDC056987]|uniref:isopenicillin N synthase family dioxygenase n=1 Tax=Streptomyces sp. NPDC056987 TaxID=3345988 RepID=UPI0036306005
MSGRQEPGPAPNRQAAAEQDGLGRVPFVDLGLDRPHDPARRAANARAIGRACETGGFFLATGHGVPRDTIAAVYDAAARFFSLPDGVKSTMDAEPGDPLQRGFIRGDLEKYSLSRLGEPVAAGWKPLQDPVLGIPNKWPALPEFREPCLAYYAAVEAVAMQVTQLFALALELPENWFHDKFDRHMTQLAVNHYQPHSAAFEGRRFRNDPHQDWGTLTLLHQGDDDTDGLQILGESEQWLDIPYSPDTFVVHIGDLMARWTNDRWASAIHRVLNPPPEDRRRDRTSLAFFYQPNHDAVVECIPTCATESDPPKYPPVVSHDYIAAKIRRAYVVGRLAQAGRTLQQVGGVPRLRPDDARRAAPRS